MKDDNGNDILNTDRPQVTLSLILPRPERTLFGCGAVSILDGILGVDDGTLGYKNNDNFISKKELYLNFKFNFIIAC